MPKQSFAIDASNWEAVKAYIQEQFRTLSWWPTEEPDRAKEEFEAMQSNPDRLAEWCEKWLNGGQWRQLENAVRKSSGRA
jgi:hypothetical protein